MATDYPADTAGFRLFSADVFTDLGGFFDLFNDRRCLCFELDLENLISENAQFTYRGI